MLSFNSPSSKGLEHVFVVLRPMIVKDKTRASLPGFVVFTAWRMK